MDDVLPAWLWIGRDGASVRMAASQTVGECEVVSSGQQRGQWAAGDGALARAAEATPKIACVARAAGVRFDHGSSADWPEVSGKFWADLAEASGKLTFGSWANWSEADSTGER